MKQFKIRHSSPLIAAIEKIMATKILKKGLGRTLQAIAMHWNPKGEIFPSQDRLADLTSNDRRTIVTHIKKLKELGVITSKRRPNIVVNGEQIRQSSVYTFVESKLGELLNLAKKTLRAAAAKKARKDHLASKRKDLTISIPKVIQKEKENTVKKNASRVFLETRLKALQEEITHLGKLALDSAYKATVKKNRIERGEILSDDAIAMKKALSARTAHIREKSAKVNDTVRSLETALLTWNATKTGFTADMFNELSKFKSMLSTMGNAVFKRYSATL
jgi:DNA-binding transcriptional regulator YhcF (GntR family)